MNYYVIQRVGSGLVVYGPYKTEKARDNRYDKTTGGEVHRFQTFTDIPLEAEREFRAAEADRL